MTNEARALDYEKLRAFLVQAVSDVGTATLGALSFIGDRLDLFKAMAAAGPVTIEELAEAAGFREFRRLPIEDPFSVLYALRA